MCLINASHKRILTEGFEVKGYLGAFFSKVFNIRFVLPGSLGIRNHKVAVDENCTTRRGHVVLAGIAEYGRVRNPRTGRSVQAVRLGKT